MKRRIKSGSVIDEINLVAWSQIEIRHHLVLLKRGAILKEMNASSGFADDVAEFLGHLVHRFIVPYSYFYFIPRPAYCYNIKLLWQHMALEPSTLLLLPFFLLPLQLQLCLLLFPCILNFGRVVYAICELYLDSLQSLRLSLLSPKKIVDVVSFNLHLLLAPILTNLHSFHTAFCMGDIPICILRDSLLHNLFFHVLDVGACFFPNYFTISPFRHNHF